ncbi:MAG TPA: hypothetical protein PK683_01230 [Leptospiraceae bacterium]|nr:hypothetical protein [Leptospiraceae bacterium]
MKKYLLIFAVIFSAGSISSQESSDFPPLIPTVTNPSVPSPKGFRNFKEVKGDLDGDGTDELLVAYEAEKETDSGKERQVHIFKKEDNKWKLLKKFTGLLRLSNEGGMMGDPFQDINIKKGVIIIDQSGGTSSHRWIYVHKFRKQNNSWELIGVTSQDYNMNETSYKYDYNLNTGKVEVEIESTPTATDKNGETVAVEGDPITRKYSFTLKKKTVLMENFKVGENEVKIPGKKKLSFFY